MIWGAAVPDASLQTDRASWPDSADPALPPREGLEGVGPGWRSAPLRSPRMSLGTEALSRDTSVRTVLEPADGAAVVGCVRLVGSA